MSAKMSNQTSNQLWLLLYALASIVLYYLVFRFSQPITKIAQSKDIPATLSVMLIIVGASILYGNTASLFLKNTLERKLCDRGRKGMISHGRCGTGDN